MAEGNISSAFEVRTQLDWGVFNVSTVGADSLQNGVGVREMLFLQASKWFSFQPEISVSASLLFTMITAFFSLFGVIFQIRKLNLKPTETP